MIQLAYFLGNWIVNVLTLYYWMMETNTHTQWECVAQLKGNQKLFLFFFISGMMPSKLLQGFLLGSQRNGEKGYATFVNHNTLSPWCSAVIYEQKSLTLVCLCFEPSWF